MQVAALKPFYTRFWINWAMIGNMPDRPTLTTQGFQDKLLVTKKGSDDAATSQPPLIVVSRPCARTCEARESALLNALLYIDGIISCCIGDLHYADFLIRQSRTWQ